MKKILALAVVAVGFVVGSHAYVSHVNARLDYCNAVTDASMGEMPASMPPVNVSWEQQGRAQDEWLRCRLQREFALSHS